MFTGEFRHTIDGKGRVAVPARFRADLAAGATVCRWLENCVAIFPKTQWQQLADAASAERYADAGARAFTRFLFSGAFEVELDGQGRLVLPASLRKFAGLQSDAVVVGAADHIELWEPARWDGISAEMSSEEFAERIGGLGI
ncbi:MAG: division/cell wall cluster transcriptional repressor MraZ [Chloroflexota bacterium]|nr:division/cell wall cluster transcriptional repressor MraZ [Chloroflexota bacterium]